jgi:hypothetical protein
MSRNMEYVFSSLFEFFTFKVANVELCRNYSINQRMLYVSLFFLMTSLV